MRCICKEAGIQRRPCLIKVMPEWRSMLFPFHFVIDRIVCMVVIGPKLVGTEGEVLAT